MDRIQILYAGSLKEFIKNKMSDRGHFEKMAAQKTCGHDIL